MKVGFVVVMHKSNVRKDGFVKINTFITTLYKFCRRDFILYLFDNESDEEYCVPNYPNIVYTYIENQMLKGLHILSDGINKAVEDNCDIVFLANDDIVFNRTINKFIDIISRHEHKDVGLYGPLSDGVLERSPQYSKGVGVGIVETTNEVIPANKIIRGFLFGFTKEFWERFKLHNGRIVNTLSNWKGGELNLIKRIVPLGGRTFIIKDCWIHHKSSKGVNRMLRLNKRKKMRNESKNKTKNTVRRKRTSKR